ncbi:hypothetical protein AHF37_01409 [Paragonimus kellicotti]|nr:hypothetical protein AHF37_01409 [Paragonimus kellicotti]
MTKQRNVVSIPDETMVTSDPADQTTERSDGTLDEEESTSQSIQYDVIKAQTDTPASPTESGTSTTSTSTSSASKIIPISPTSAKRLSSSLSHPKAGVRHNNPGSFVSRKNPGSVNRFPRPPLGNSERKRRANHTSEKMVHASGSTQMFATVSGGHIGHDTDSSKPSKFERLSREDSGDSAVQEKIPSSIHAASPVTPGKSHQMSSNSIKKKHFLTSSSTGIVEDNVSKRAYGSLVGSSSQTAELKRKKHSEPSKQSTSSIPLANNFNSAQYELEDSNNIQFVVVDNSQTTTSNAKVPRSSLHSLVRSGSQGIVGPSKKSHTNTPFTSSVTSTLTTANTNSGGLIKGYKIPKKKASGSNSAVMKTGLTEERQDSVCTVSSETVSPSKTIVSKTIDLNVSDPYSLSDFAPISPLLSTSFSTHSTTSTVCSSQLPHGPNYTKSEFNPPQPSVATIASVVTSQSGASQLQQLPRRQSMKSIIDIVDKLRAKSSSSTGSLPSAIQSSSANNLQASQDSQVRSETDDKANFQEVCFVAAPGDRDSAQDPRGDNIFEKFYAG